MARGKAVQVMGIWLRRLGDEVVVSAETIGGHDVELIREQYDSAFSHNISEHGIASRFGAGVLNTAHVRRTSKARSP
jgi:hypothetical protein